MQRCRQIVSNSRGLILALALLALAVRMLVPAGFMPVHDGQRTTLTLCTGHGPLVVPWNSGQGAGTAGHHAGDASPECGFDVLGAPALDGDAAPVFVATAAATEAVSYPGPSALRVEAREHLRPPLRGPPAAVDG